jgi:Mlc titration factor MtfA (ptsG expression regulator)
MLPFAVPVLAFAVTAFASSFVATQRAKKAHEQALRSKPFPKEWEKYLEKNVKLYGHLPDHLRDELKGYVNLFVATKHFEGAGGLEVTDEMRVTVAALACILLLNRKTRNYPKLRTVILYPSAYIADPETDTVRLGESWNDGEVVLSWNHVTSSSNDLRDGTNLVLHEFAHRLDQEDGAGDGVPELETQAQYFTWAEVMSGEFKRLRSRVDKGYKTLIRPYGATNAAEFFACITENFFERPHQLKRKHPEIYEELQTFYHLDPVSWDREEKNYLGSPFKK